jgi:hypothetical protein
MEELTDDEAIELYVQWLVEEGALVLDGVSEDGEPIYLHNIEKLEELAPEYLALYLKEVEDALISLYAKGYVDIEISDKGEVLYKAKKTE